MSTLSQLEKAAGPNTCQYVAKSPDRGDFLVQVAWPLAWSKDGVPPEDDPTPQTLYAAAITPSLAPTNAQPQLPRGRQCVLLDGC